MALLEISKQKPHILNIHLFTLNNWDQGGVVVEYSPQELKVMISIARLDVGSLAYPISAGCEPKGLHISMD